MAGIAFGKCSGRMCPRIFISLTKTWKGIYLHSLAGTRRYFFYRGKFGTDYMENFHANSLAARPTTEGPDSQ